MKSIKLIKPCKKNWSDMTELEKGMFCSTCSKMVTDFSQLSPEEILESFKSPKASICARMTKEQINTPLFEIKKPKQRKTLFSKFAAIFILVTSLLTTQSCESNEVLPPIHVDQNSNEPTKDNTPEENQQTTSLNNPVGPIFFKGKLISQKTKKPLENAQIVFITLLDTYTAFTDAKGAFKLEIPSTIIKDKNVVRVSFKNIFDEYNDDAIRLDNYYKTENLVLSKKEIEGSFLFEAKPEVFFLGGIGLHDNQPVRKPIVLVNGEEIKFEEFQKARAGKLSSCNLNNKDYFYLETKPAIALYGKKAKDGLYLFMNTKN